LGIEKAIESIPDLVVSDLMMPEMDGMELCDRLKSDERTNHIPVILLTAKADRESKLKGLKTGADDYIIKPFDAEELRVRIANLIELRRKLKEKFSTEFLDERSISTVPTHEDKLLKKLLASFNKHLDNPDFRIGEMTAELGLSRTQLFRKTQALTGHSPTDLLSKFRLRRAARMFRDGHRNVGQVMYDVGFNTPSYFAKSFRQLYGSTPSEFIKKI
jgi:YesN/AraC family two-component response regulator